MGNFNKVYLMGNLTRNPELRYTPQNKAVVTLSIAVNREWRDRNGERVKDVAFFHVTVWGKQAENCNTYLEKGRPVFIEGRLTQEKWQDKNTGDNRSRMNIVAEKIQFLGGGNGTRKSDPDEGYGDNRQDDTDNYEQEEMETSEQPFNADVDEDEYEDL